MRFLGVILLLLSGLAQAQEWSFARPLRYGNSEGGGAAVDHQRALYVSGAFDQPVVIGTNHFTPFSETDILLTKYSRHGDLLWARRVGSFDHDVANGVVVDHNGNAYLQAVHYAPLIVGNLTNGALGGIETSIVKYNPEGDVQWVKRLVGNTISGHTTATVDEQSHFYMAGSFWETAQLGSTSLMSRGWSDLFVTRLDSSGNQLWTTHLGGDGFDRAYAIATHGTNAVYVVGLISSNAWFGTLQFTNCQGWYSGFVAKLDGAGNVVWVKLLTSPESVEAMGVAVDRAGDVVVSGKFRSTMVLGSTNILARGLDDAFVMKLAPNGHLKWVKTAGSPQEDFANGIQIDRRNRIYLSGRFENACSFGPTNLVGTGYDLFIARYETDGTLDFATSAGGPQWDEPYSMALAPDETAWLVGYFQNRMTFGNHSITNTSGDDHFPELFMAQLSLPARLRARNVDGQLEVSWDSEFHTLETASPVNTSWFPLTNSPLKTSSNLLLRFPPSGAGALFRVKRD